MPGPRHLLEDGVPVSVYGDRYPMTLYDPPHQQKVVTGVLVLTERGVGNHACGIVNGQKQCELRPVPSKPPMVAAVYLYQHPLSGHSLTAYSVFRWPAAARTSKASPTSMRLNVVLPMTMPSRSLSSSLRWVWLVSE